MHIAYWPTQEIMAFCFDLNNNVGYRYHISRISRVSGTMRLDEATCHGLFYAQDPVQHHLTYGMVVHVTAEDAHLNQE